MRRVLLLVVIALVGTAIPAHAHIGNKDVYETVEAGPYKLFVTVRTPLVIPGVATVEARVSGPEVSGIKITPLPLTGEASKHAPAADAMRRSGEDKAFYTGSLWIMAQGSWQVRFVVEGAGGEAAGSVPVPAVPLKVLPMQRPLGILLGALGLVLCLGMAGIVAAAVRDARLRPGVEAPAPRRRRALAASVATLAIVGLMVWGGGRWWRAEAAEYASDVYRPTKLVATLTGDRLDLKLGEYKVERSRWIPSAKDELLLDHGHVMHLYAIRQPEMDAVFHLHPELVGDRELAMTLPAMPAGEYRLYGDVVHANGFPETLTATLEIPEGFAGTRLGPEDASAEPPALSKGELGTTYRLPDGYAMVWDRPEELEANKGYMLRFRLLDASGRPAEDMETYLGMAGHAAFVKTDGTVFAHTHPDGSAAMPAMMMANGGAGEMSGMGGPMDGMDMSQMPGMSGMSNAKIAPVVEFPYGFPSAGRYRVFIQMKHGGVVETGVFDADVR